MSSLFGEKKLPEVESKAALANYSIKFSVKSDGALDLELDDGTGFRKPSFLGKNSEKKVDEINNLGFFAVPTKPSK